MEILNIYSLNLGLTNKCNALCDFCPVKKTVIDRCDMPLSMVQNILNQVNPTHHVSLALFGESTLYKHLPDVIQMIKQPTILYTNGILLEPGMVRGLDRLVISLDATSKDEYIKTKGIDKYDTVLSNIKKILKTKDRPHITIQYADLKYSGKLRTHGADKMKHGRIISWGGEIQKTTRKRKPLPCGHIFNFLNIASNGDIVLCCLDYNHLFNLGNVNDNSIYDIWFGERFEQIRQDQINGIFHDICKNCENEYYHNAQ